MADINSKDIWGDAPEDSELESELAAMSTEEIRQRTRMIENETKTMKNEINRLTREQKTQENGIKENIERIKLHKQLPYLVSNVVEVFFTFSFSFFFLSFISLLFLFLLSSFSFLSQFGLLSN